MQIRLAGLLVDYTVTKDGREILTRRTSLTRNAGRYFWYTSLAVFVALGFVWFVRRPVAE